MTRFIALFILLTCNSFAKGEFSRTYIDQFALSSTHKSGVKISYKVLGQSDQTVVLIMGLGSSHILWGDSFIKGIVDANYKVVLVDNRDTGESEKFTEWGEPTIWWQFLKNYLGLNVDAPYLLEDMAKDIIAVMDELELEKAHIVGASMGGMIAQILTAQHPDRVTSLTSIMSSTGAKHLPPPSSDSNKRLKALAGGDLDQSNRFAAMGFEPAAVPRQLMAIIKAGDRSQEVASIKVPTLVLHGANDSLIPPAHGEHTASLIKNSRYILFEGMGHNLPDAVLPDLIRELTAHLAVQSQ